MIRKLFAAAGLAVLWLTLAQPAAAQDGPAFDLVVRAVRPTTAGLVNGVSISATNAAGGSATAAPLRIAGWPANALGLTKTAQVLDVALGEPVPYQLVLRNLGTVALRGFVVRDLLPAGMRYVPASLVGADSATVNACIKSARLSSDASKLAAPPAGMLISRAKGSSPT
jgi:uncharacterized repeat protein (TIGR01451 family)